MYERSYGYLYDEKGKADTADIARAIRSDIKRVKAEGLLPARWTYSVRTHRFSGGTAIDVAVKGCPDAWQECDGMKVGSRHQLPTGGSIGTACGNVWCKAGGQYKDSPHAATHQVLTEEAEAARMTLERIHGAYNHTGSDVMTDYFDVNYYGTVSFDR